jgi:hypothetical protein
MWKGKETKQKVERKGDNKERECNTHASHTHSFTFQLPSKLKTYTNTRLADNFTTLNQVTGE